MADYVSMNGYTASDDPRNIPGGVVTVTPKGAPESQFRVRGGDVATIFQYLLDRYQAEVESIDLYRQGSGDDWGYTFRMVRGSTSRLSNHSSATAVDVNATRHPLGTHPTANFTTKQINAIRRILNDLDGTIGWGGDYSGRKDPMHFEISAGLDQVAKVAARIRASKQAEEAELPNVNDIFNTDNVIPQQDGDITGNPKNPGVAFSTFLRALWRKVTATRDDVAQLRKEVAAVSAKLDALGKDPAP